MYVLKSRVQIDNDLVRRQLIINQGIEQTLLIESRREADSTMYDRGTLPNVKQCFSLNENKPGWGVRFGYGRGGEANSAPIPPFQGRPRMKTDIESQIRSVVLVAMAPFADTETKLSARHSSAPEA